MGWSSASSSNSASSSSSSSLMTLYAPIFRSGKIASIPASRLGSCCTDPNVMTAGNLVVGRDLNGAVARDEGM